MTEYIPVHFAVIVAVIALVSKYFLNGGVSFAFLAKVPKTRLTNTPFIEEEDKISYHAYGHLSQLARKSLFLMPNDVFRSLPSWPKCHEVI